MSRKLNPGIITSFILILFFVSSCTGCVPAPTLGSDSIGVTTCTSDSTNSPVCTSIPQATQETIIQSAISAMSNLTTFHLDTSLTEHNNTDSAASTMPPYIWTSNRDINNTGKDLFMSMYIDMGPPPLTSFSFEIYQFDKTLYRRGLLPTVYSLKTGEPIPPAFNESQSTNDTAWNKETQIEPLLGLLRGADKILDSGSDTVNGADCSAISFIPSQSSVVDWIESQDFGVGPGIFSLFHEDWPKYYRDAAMSGNFVVWIDKNASLVMKMEIDVSFEGSIDLYGEPTPSTGFDKIQFTGTFNFSNYGQPVSIQLPQETTTPTTTTTPGEYYEIPISQQFITDNGNPPHAPIIHLSFPASWLIDPPANFDGAIILRIPKEFISQSNTSTNADVVTAVFPYTFFIGLPNPLPQITTLSTPP